MRRLAFPASYELAKTRYDVAVHAFIHSSSRVFALFSCKRFVLVCRDDLILYDVSLYAN